MIIAIHAEVPNHPVAEIRYEMMGNHIYVDTFVNGKGPFHFIFDTGAGGTVIDAQRARELGLTPHGAVRSGGAGSSPVTADIYPDVKIRVGNVPVSVQTIYGLPLAMASRFAGRAIDGVIGYDFYHSYVVEFDYQASKIRLYRPADYRYRGSGETLPFQLVMNHVRIKASVVQPNREPIAGEFTIDTGAANTMTLASPYVAAHDLLTAEQKRLPEGIIGVGAAGPTMGIISRLEALRVGKFILKRPVTDFSTDKGGYFAGTDLAGNIGYGILKRFKVIVNYAQSQITLEQNSQFGVADDDGFSGVSLTTDLPDFRPIRVDSVWKGSPAEQAGLQPGDIILTVNDRSADRYSVAELRELIDRENTHVVLMVQRGTNTLRVEFVVAPIK